MQAIYYFEYALFYSNFTFDEFDGNGEYFISFDRIFKYKMNDTDNV